MARFLILPAKTEHNATLRHRRDLTTAVVPTQPPIATRYPTSGRILAALHAVQVARHPRAPRIREARQRILACVL